MWSIRSEKARFLIFNVGGGELGLMTITAHGHLLIAKEDSALRAVLEPAAGVTPLAETEEYRVSRHASSQVGHPCRI